MVAATWGKTFDLNDEVDEIREALEPKGFGDIDRETVLKCMSAVQLGTIKEQSLMTLRALGKAEMRALISATKEALLRTVDLLSTEFNIYSWDFLSYEALVVILCSVHAKISNLAPDQVRRARQWFWRASFAERYKVGGEGFVSNDIKAVYEFIVNGSGAAKDFGEPPAVMDWKEIAFRSNVSRSRAFVLALAAMRPRNLTNGALIDPAQALSSYNKKQFHHVYPRAFLKRTGVSTNDNLLANICMLTAVANNFISDSDPAKYVPAAVVMLGPDADEVFRSNMLPIPSSFDYAKATYDQFLDSRIALVASTVEKLCAGDHL